MAERAKHTRSNTSSDFDERRRSFSAKHLARFSPSRHASSVINDTQRGMLPGIPKSAICVQRFDDSLNSAIRITYRISLRSSSSREPRYPLLRVDFVFYFFKSKLD